MYVFNSNLLLFFPRWPQFSFPSFKITSSTCLQKVRIGEQISLVRFVKPRTKTFYLNLFLFFNTLLKFEIVKCLFVFVFLEERVKFAWPLSAREALVHYFFFEYFQDDLIVILVNMVVTSNTWIWFHFLCNWLSSHISGNLSKYFCTFALDLRCEQHW